MKVKYSAASPAEVGGMMADKVVTILELREAVWRARDRVEEAFGVLRDAEIEWRLAVKSPDTLRDAEVTYRLCLSRLEVYIQAVKAREEAEERMRAFGEATDPDPDEAEGIEEGEEA